MKRPYKYTFDGHLSAKLDILEKTGVVPGSHEDKERSRKIDAIRRALGYDPR